MVWTGKMSLSSSTHSSFHVRDFFPLILARLIAKKRFTSISPTHSLRFSNFVFPARLWIVLYLKKLGFTQLHLPAHLSNKKVEESKALKETFIRFPVGVFELFPLIFVDLFINCLKKKLVYLKRITDCAEMVLMFFDISFIPHSKYVLKYVQRKCRKYSIRYHKQFFLGFFSSSQEKFYINAIY